MQNIFENKPQTSIKETGSPEIERWKAPDFEEILATKNDFHERWNRRDIFGFMKLVLLQRMQEGFVSPQDTKEFFQSLLLSDRNYFEFDDDIKVYREHMYDDKNKEKMSMEERERDRKCFYFFKSLQSTTHGEKDEGGFFEAPKRRVSGAGTFLTNIYRNPENNNGQLMHLEQLDFRVNLACEHPISNRRILVELYQQLCSNEILAEKGFMTKSLGNNRTDSVIVYCGKVAMPAVLEEVVNYCIRENVCHDLQGVPFGVKPLDKDGNKHYGISVTSSPHGGYTFNSLQADALFEAFQVVTNKSLKPVAGIDFDNALPMDLKPLYKKIKAKNETLLIEMEKEYEIALRKLCKTDVVNMHNLAFPQVKEH